MARDKIAKIIALSLNKNEPSATLNDQHEISPGPNEAEFAQQEEKKPPHRLSLLYARMKQSGYLEFAALIVAVLATTTIVGLLIKYDNKPVPTWTRKFSLNGVISLLSAVATLGVAECVQHSLGQLKWVRFAEDACKLNDIQKYDSASRGPRGALKMLVRHPSLDLVTVALIVIVLRLAYEPFTQNLVQYYDGVTPSGFHKAVTAKTPMYESHGPEIYDFIYELSPDMIAKMYTAIFVPTQSQLLQPQFNCPTGNCTWAPFTTFAVCPLCTNVTSKLTRNWTEDYPSFAGFPGNFSYINLTDYAGDQFGAVSDGELHEYLRITKLPLGSPGYFYNSSIGGVWLSIRADISVGTTSDNATGIDYHLAVIDNTTNIIGMECALMPCVQSLNATAINGVYKENVLAIFTDVEILGGADGQYLQLNPPWGSEQGMEEGQTFGMATQAYSTITRSPNAFDTLFTGFVDSSSEDNGGTYEFTNDTMEAIFYANFTNTSCANRDKIICSFEAFAQGINKAIRDAPLIENANNLNSTYLASGVTLINTTFIRVRWGWISLPAAILFLSFVSWLGTIWQVKRVQLPWWDTKILPLLFLYREEAGDLEADQAGANGFPEPEIHFDSTSSGYKERAKKVRARVVFERGVPRLLASTS